MSTKIPCEKDNCAAFGTFNEEQCPGSDDENHHCVDCGELWWDEKGAFCDLCGDYWCPLGWQNTFVFVESCEHGVDCHVEMVCVKCFRANLQLHCKEAGCALNVDVVEQKMKKQDK